VASRQALFAISFLTLLHLGGDGVFVGDVQSDLIVEQDGDERVVQVENLTGDLSVDALVSVGGEIGVRFSK